MTASCAFHFLSNLTPEFRSEEKIVQKKRVHSILLTSQWNEFCGGDSKWSGKIPCYYLFAILKARRDFGKQNIPVFKIASASDRIAGFRDVFRDKCVANKNVLHRNKRNMSKI